MGYPIPFVVMVVEKDLHEVEGVISEDHTMLLKELKLSVENVLKFPVITDVLYQKEIL